MKAPQESGDSKEEGASVRYTTGEMARLSNNTLRTVRFYEEAGILQPIGRTEGGHRIFDRSQLDRLLFITDLREAGVSLEEIREMLELKSKAHSGGEAAHVAVEKLRGHIAELQKKMAVLSRLSEDMQKTVDCATACTACEDEKFPAHCGECSRLSSRAPLPRGTRVLWAVSDLGSKNGR